MKFGKFYDRSIWGCGSILEDIILIQREGGRAFLKEIIIQEYVRDIYQIMYNLSCN